MPKSPAVILDFCVDGSTLAALLIANPQLVQKPAPAATGCPQFAQYVVPVPFANPHFTHIAAF